MEYSAQTKPALFTVNQPNPFDFRKPEEWKNWKTRFDRYSSLSGLNQRGQRSQIDALIYTMGPEAERIFNSLILTKEERNLYHEVVRKLEAYFLEPRVNVISERAKFNQRVQQVGESFNSFVEELNKLAENCRFGSLKEEYVRDRIVAGMSNLTLSYFLQMDPDLTLNKLIAMVKNSGFVEQGSPRCPSPCSSPSPTPSYDVPEQQAEPNEQNSSSDLSPEEACSEQEPMKFREDKQGDTEQQKINRQNQKNMCSICKKIFPYPSKLKRHLKRTDHHTGEKQFSCDICGAKLATKNNMENHKLKIHPVESFECDICKKIFQKKNDLQKHRNRTHPKDKSRRYCCEICGKIISSRENFKRHKKIHTGEKPFSCEVCGKKFSRLNRLHDHRRVHDGEKPFCCEVCGKTFPYQTSMKAHISAVHRGQKVKRTFHCPCGKSFSTKHKLDDHTRTHTGEKPFSCDMCDYRCAQKSNLKIHKRVHKPSEESMTDKNGKASQKM